VKLNEILTGPPLKLRVVHFDGRIAKSTGPNTISAFEFEGHVLRAIHVHLASGIDVERWIVDQDCHLPDLSTGHHDKDGKGIYGGDVRRFNSEEIKITGDYYFIVVWKQKDTSFCIHWLSLSLNVGCSIETVLTYSTYLGNIHNPEALPEEVRRMLND
jgi:phenolic acid decarboxylase